MTFASCLLSYFSFLPFFFLLCNLTDLYTLSLHDALPIYRLRACLAMIGLLTTSCRGRVPATPSPTRGERRPPGGASAPSPPPGGRCGSRPRAPRRAPG